MAKQWANLTSLRAFASNFTVYYTTSLLQQQKLHQQKKKRHIRFLCLANADFLRKNSEKVKNRGNCEQKVNFIFCFFSYSFASFFFLASFLDSFPKDLLVQRKFHRIAYKIANEHFECRDPKAETVRSFQSIFRPICTATSLGKTKPQVAAINLIKARSTLLQNTTTVFLIFCSLPDNVCRIRQV